MHTQWYHKTGSVLTIEASFTGYMEAHLEGYEPYTKAHLVTVSSPDDQQKFWAYGEISCWRDAIDSILDSSSIEEFLNRLGK